MKSDGVLTEEDKEKHLMFENFYRITRVGGGNPYSLKAAIAKWYTPNLQTGLMKLMDLDRNSDDELRNYSSLGEALGFMKESEPHTH